MVDIKNAITEWVIHNMEKEGETVVSINPFQNLMLGDALKFITTIKTNADRVLIVTQRKPSHAWYTLSPGDFMSRRYNHVEKIDDYIFATWSKSDDTTM